MTAAGEATAVVLNWRTPDHTLRAARALLADGVPAERLVVVDNGSGDGSAELIRRELSGCRVLALPQNVGFARGNNLAARELPGRAFLFVNSDAFVHAPGSVGRLLRATEPGRAGLAVPRLLNPDLTLQANVVPTSSPLSALVRASGLSRYVPNRFQPSLAMHWDHGESRAIQAAIGAVVAVRADAWEALGGFDEREFMYAEDIDLFWRARKLGFEVRFVAEAEFVHLGNASGGRRWSDPARAERAARAEAAMIREHLPRARATVTLALMALGVGARAAIRRAQRRRDEAATLRATLRGYGAGVRGAL
jgi:N-acetylglucosaminyl-diphospho-decaprenol L-rhamnosyltransferase